MSICEGSERERREKESKRERERERARERERERKKERTPSRLDAQLSKTRTGQREVSRRVAEDQILLTPTHKPDYVQRHPPKQTNDLFYGCVHNAKTYTYSRNPNAFKVKADNIKQ